MKKNINIEDLKKENIFKVPSGYFENFPEKLSILLSQDKEEGLKVTSMPNITALENIKKEIIFKVPDNFFEGLAGSINNRLELNYFDEESNIDYEENLGILSSIEKKNIFQAPDGYFEKFSVDVEKEWPQLYKEKSKTLLPSWLKYSASVAAVFILIFVGYGFYKNNHPVAAPCEELLCNVSDDEILQYLDENGIGVENRDKNLHSNNEELKNNKSITEDELLDEIDARALDHLEN